MYSIFIKRIIYFSFTEHNFARSYYTFYLFNIGRSNFRPVSNEGNFSSVITTADSAETR